MKKTKTNIDFTKAPYKGVLSEVARDLGISQQAVSQAVNKYKTAHILKLVTQKIEQRKHAIKRFHNSFAS